MLVGYSYRWLGLANLLGRYLATEGYCRKRGAVKGSEVSGFFEPRSGGPPYLPDIRTTAGTDVVTRNTEGSDEQLAAGNRA